MERREQEETVGERILAGPPSHCSSITSPTHSVMTVFGDKDDKNANTHRRVEQSQLSAELSLIILRYI